MGERTRYAPGTFCWTDLATTDQAGAKAFYGRVFGWEAAKIAVAKDPQGAVFALYAGKREP